MHLRFLNDTMGIHRKLVLWGCGRCELREDMKAASYELPLPTAHVCQSALGHSCWIEHRALEYRVLLLELSKLW